MLVVIDTDRIKVAINPTTIRAFFIMSQFY